MASGNNFNSNAEYGFPELKLEDEGLYTLKFYILMNCDDNSNCSSYDDYIDINLIFNNGEIRQKIERYDFKNIGGIRRWMVKGFSFYACKTQVKVSWKYN